MKITLLPFVLLFTPVCVHAREYWQQRVDTKLEVTLDDKRHMLYGHEECSYTNKSPDTLRYIYIHLWPNAYSHDHTQFAEQQYRNGSKGFYYAPSSDRGYIDSLSFTIDGQEVGYYSTDKTPDIARIDLPAPLLPGGQIKLATPFRVKMPAVFSRMGHTGQAYYASQWFPKPAVYDRRGWHPIPYLDLGEFYSEIGSYDVSITLPGNYVVMATGNLAEQGEEAWLDSLAQIPFDTVVSKTVKEVPFPPSSPTLKTLHFHEDNIHDFAWFADKRWLVRKDTVVSDDKQVIAYAAFLPSYQRSWKKVPGYLVNAVEYYGKWVGPYPYKTIKAVQGDMKAGGGMEYPTVTIIDRNSGDRTTIIHEAGHNWFYGILATNERDHAWMDEGINTFYEQKTGDTLDRIDTTKSRNVVARKSGFNIDLSEQTILYQLQASGLDQAIGQTSANFKEINYGLDVYYKTAILMRWLEAYMGERDFEEGMHDYYHTWKHRHPYPEDFKEVMQKHTNRSIDWFFDEALRTDRVIDFSVKKVQTKDDEVIVTLKNKSGSAVPASVNAYHGDNLLYSMRYLPPAGTTPAASYSGYQEYHLPKEALSWTKIRIDPTVPDGRTPNNEYRRSGLFHRSGLKPALLAGTVTGNRQKIFILPALGYNMYDGLGAGLVLHNLTWPETGFRYVVAPMYGFRSRHFIGAASLGYDWHPRGIFKEIMLQADLKSFDYDETFVNVAEPLFARYIKIAPSLSLTFRQPTFTSPVTRTLTLKGYAINEESVGFTFDPSDSLYKPSIGQEQNYYGRLRYTHRNARLFNPFSYALEAKAGEYFASLSAEGNLRIDYNTKNKALHVRAYAGKFFTIRDKPFVTERYYLNTTFTGPNDYLYDDTYIGRNDRDGFGAAQVSIREGGFKIPTPLYATPLGRSDDWMAALNIKTDLPLKKLPLRLYLDVGAFSDAYPDLTENNPKSYKVLLEGGLELHASDILNIYLPLFMSGDYKDYLKQHAPGLLQRITFSMQLSRINWLKAPSGIFSLFGY